MSYNVAVLLSGCGYIDGTEPQEASLVFFALSKCGLNVVPIAPNVYQAHVADHLNNKNQAEERGVLSESARIGRGTVLDINEVDKEKLDALILPGGLGSLKNLSNFAHYGIDFSILTAVSELVKYMYLSKKPMVFIGNSVILAAKIFADLDVKLAVNNDKSLSYVLRELGADPLVINVHNIAFDVGKMLISCIGFLNNDNIYDVFLGLERAVNILSRLLRK